MEKIASLLSKADFVGNQLKPTLNSSNRVKSPLGGFISAVVAVCIGFGFVYFGLSMIRRDKPIMNVVQEMREEAIIYTKENPMMMIIFDGNGNMIHNNPAFKRAVKVEVELWRARPHPDTSFEITVYKGQTKACDKTEMSEEVYSQLLGQGYIAEIAFCHDSSSFVSPKGEKLDEDIYLKNRYAYFDSDYMIYNFIHCDEEADPGCGDYLQTIPRANINFYKLNYYIDQTDYENPTKPNLIAAQYSLSTSIQQTVYIPTRINEIVTDSSFFLNNESKQTYYTMITPTMNVSTYKPEQKLMLEVILSGENIVNVNQRRYLKIPELLANMGGFMKAALFIGNLLSYCYSDYIYFCAVTKLQTKFARVNTKVYLAESDAKSSVCQIKPDLIINELQIPSFFQYLKLFFTKKRELNKQTSYKYLELGYLIDCLSFVEEMKKRKLNNFVNK